MPSDALSPPAFGPFERHLHRLCHSAPGPDLLPYSAWQKAPLGAEILYESLQWVLEGHSLLYGFNFLTGVFMPKGEGPGDSLGGG
eukprot:6269421-Pyramimonas_sp.AAC.1